MKRFRILNQRDGFVEFKAETTQEIFDQLNTKLDTALESYMIDDVIDDIEVSDIDFLAAFYDGECPGDLQFF